MVCKSFHHHYGVSRALAGGPRVTGGVLVDLEGQDLNFPILPSGISSLSVM